MKLDREKPRTQGERKTEEQIHDVYAEGTSDGNVRLENKTIRVAKED